MKQKILVLLKKLKNSKVIDIVILFFGLIGYFFEYYILIFYAIVHFCVQLAEYLSENLKIILITHCIKNLKTCVYKYFYNVQIKSNLESTLPQMVTVQFYNKTWIPSYGIKTNCYGRDATDLEKELFESSKKKNDE
jgi:hypothetical protein